jgi:pimeloyl-ACP methyl ester carboxylesterase
MPPRVSAQALGESVRDDAVEAVRAMKSSGSGLLSTIGPDPLGLLWQIAAISTWSSIPVLGCIEAPTLVVCGDRDRAVLPANSRLLAARIRDARLVTIQAGHDLQAPRPAAIVAQLVEQFLDSMPLRE